jgi:hypothetical protein
MNKIASKPRQKPKSKDWCDHYEEDRSLYVDSEIPYDSISTLTPEQETRLWTLLDFDGKSFIVSGFRWVNRIAHLMSTKPCKPEDEHVEFEAYRDSEAMD